MKILQLCKKVPWPAKDGETIAIYNLCKGFSLAGHQVTVLGMNTPKHKASLDKLPVAVKAVAEFYKADVDTSIKAVPLLANFFRSGSYNIDRFISTDYSTALKQLLLTDNFDVIQLEGLYLTPYLSTIRKLSKAPVVMRSHNVESRIWERMAEGEKNFLKKRYISFLAKRLSDYEQSHLNSYDAIVPISPNDADEFRGMGCRIPMHTSPVGVEWNGYKVSQTPDVKSLYYLGALDWIPNQEGLSWFLDEVWPAIHSRHPDFRFYIAGRNAPPNFLALKKPGVEMIGEVEDARDFSASKFINIVPLWSGSGIRIKILEAMAMGKCIIATPVAAEGIHYEAGKHLLIGDTAEKMISSIEHCISNPADALVRGQAARNLVKDEYDNEKLVYNLLDFYKQTFFS